MTVVGVFLTFFIFWVLRVQASDSPFDDINLRALDGSINATFIRAGAHITNLYVRDRNGTARDVVLGYDDRSLYYSDPSHPYFGAVVGRYANRIKNSTFTLPSGQIVKVAANENKGLDTLHGGFQGWDLRAWTVAAQTGTSVTFSLTDMSGEQGFPATVLASIKYTLQNGSRWAIDATAFANDTTPIMTSAHTYWNLDAYDGPQDLSSHYIQVKADRYIQTDGILIPTGQFASVNGTGLDLRQASRLSQQIQATAGTGLCGTGCTGLDNCLIYQNGTADTDVKMSLWSTNSGIRLDVVTDQIAAQVYTCNSIASLRNITRKRSQGQGVYADHSCVVLEQQSYIDAINHPDWGIDQFYGPTRNYTWSAVYAFGLV